MRNILLAFRLLVAFGATQAHVVAWTKGMYCRNGDQNTDNENADTPHNPLIDLPYSGWFMHGDCINYPPPPGEFLEFPAGGSALVELSENRAFTTFSYNGTKVTDWPDGKVHPANYSIDNLGDAHPSGAGCISSPNLHCKREADAAGTVFAIAYKSDIHKVTMEDLVVFTVAANTPYRRLATYHVPADMPACPEEGCICAWGWVPNHCGQANEYMNGYRCKITGARADARALAKPQPPAWCEGEPSKCVKGAKQMVITWEKEGNTVNHSTIVGFQADGGWPSLGYNMKMGFHDGAQNDIFVSAASSRVPAAKASSAPVTAASSSKAPSGSAPTSAPAGSSKPHHGGKGAHRKHHAATSTSRRRRRAN